MSAELERLRGEWIHDRDAAKHNGAYLDLIALCEEAEARADAADRALAATCERLAIALRVETMEGILSK